MMFQKVVAFIRDIYNTDAPIALHEPKFIGNEKKYLNECIDSTFVSSVGKFVDRFESMMMEYTGSKYAIATVNGTSALHISLLVAGVEKNDEVITQPLTFIATCNAINYCGADPVFIDVDRDTLGLSPIALKDFLLNYTVMEKGECINKVTGKVIKACVPMHTFGHPCRIDEISELCKEYNIVLIEDAAESLGSFYKDQHTGTFGKLGAFSFNGNKVITAGAGGCIVTDDELLAKKAKHLSTTAKVPHPWEYSHDMIGYNYRMPNLNAALVVAQIENLDFYLERKRALATKYNEFFSLEEEIEFILEPKESRSNYWLNAILCKDKEQRDKFLQYSNEQGIMTRPIWTSMNKLEMFKDAQCGDLSNAQWLEDRVVNISSTVIL